MKKKVTMQQIADALGITKVSVSKALNDQPGISDALKLKIQQKARELGYARNSRGKGCEIRKLVFIESKIYFLENDDFYTQIYYNLLKECSQREIDLQFSVVGEDEQKRLEMPFTFRTNTIDGIFVGGELTGAYLAMLKETGIPMVQVGFNNPEIELDSIIVDDFYNSNRITNALIRMGHRQIGFVGDENSASAMLDRYYGYLKALRENGLEYRREWHICDGDEQGRLITDYTLPEELPTAFVCHSDFAAYHLVQKLKARGLQVPSDIALTTFDNTEKARSANSIVNVDINGKRFAQYAIRQMIWRCAHPDADGHRVVINAPILVARPE